MLPISAPANRTTAQTSAAKTPAQRVPRLPTSSSRMRAVQRQIAAGAADHRGDDVGKAVGAELLVEIGGLLPRHFQARHVEQHGDRGDAAHRANFRAARASTPQSTSCCITAEIGHHKRELAEARQEPGVPHRLVLDEAEQDDIHDHEEADEGDRERKISRHPAPAAATMAKAKSEADKDLRPVESANRAWPSSPARA